LTDDSAPLRRLLGLYMALIGGALLAAVYFTVTAWIIRPLDQLSHAAKLVGSATHRLQLPTTRSAEFTLLAENLRSMTDKLADEKTALVQKVEELQQARSQLEQAQAHLVRSERLASVGQLAAGLAHEVGNPIAALQGMQDLMLSGDLDPEEQLDFTRRMRKETERISRIIRDLLDFARPASSGVGSAEPGQVETAIHETVALVTHQPALRDVELALDVYPDLPKVTLSNNHLTQVLLNLILNAAAACKGGGHVQIVARKLDKNVEISVTDDGPGVPSDMRERIFEPFVSTKDVGEGSGLGLSVCRGLVEAAGGKVWLDPSTERGARFVVSLVSC
jgi:two-component system, NtrC family, sensor kinase